MGKTKQKKKQEEKPKRVSNSNPKIEWIIEDYPEILKAHPRASFEDQLRKHLLKHNIE